MSISRKEWKEIFKKVGLYVTKEQSGRTLTTSIDLLKIDDLEQKKTLSNQSRIDSCRKYGKYHVIQLVDEKHVYALLCIVLTSNVNWLGDKYKKDRFIIIGGLYTNRDENPGVQRDIAENKLVEFEFLIKNELLPLISQ